jgi:hypothetical protein
VSQAAEVNNDFADVAETARYDFALMLARAPEPFEMGTFAREDPPSAKILSGV